MDGVVRYDMSEILDLMDTNRCRHSSLREYYVDNLNRNKDISTKTTDIMGKIIKLRCENVDPNDEVLMRSIKEYMNKLSIDTKNSIIEKIVNINYKTTHHYEFLVNEVIVKSMNDIVAYKGLEADGLIATDLYVMVIEQFYGTSIDGVPFEYVLIKKIKHYFDEYTTVIDGRSNMNRNNTHRVNNYKGLMNLIGTLFVHDEEKYELLKKIITKVRDVITDYNLTQEECDNYYDGYDRILTHFIKRFNIDEEFIDEETVSAFKSFYPFIVDMNNHIVELSTSNMKSKKNTIRKMSLNRLTKKVQYIDTFAMKYD